MGVSDQYRKTLEKNIVDAIAFGLENNTLTEEDLPNVAKFVLDRIDTIQTQEDLNGFLSELTSQWQAFKHVELVAKRDFEQQEDLSNADHAAQLLHEGNIDDALTVAKASTEE